MKIVLIVISILIVAIVLLQSGKSVGASSIISGGNDDLFSNRKERGGELFITRLTAVLGVTFMVICVLMQYVF